MKVCAQIGMVLNLDKCIGCHTCSVTCKNVWTSRPGMEYAWFNNVETKPGIGYPKEWENQKKCKSLTRNSLLRSAPGEPSSEQLDGGDIEPARGAFDGCFEVLGKAAVAVEASDGSLDHPPARQEPAPLHGI